MSTIVRKISGESILGDSRRRPDSPIWCYRVAGVAIAYESGEGDNGPYTALTGNFRAVRFDTGEEFESGTCYLPGGMAEQIAAQLNRGNKETPTEVAFVYDIGLAPDPRDSGKPATGNAPAIPPTKYVWTIRNADPTADKESKLSKVMRSLPFPPGVKALPQ